LGLSRRLFWLAALVALGCAGGPPPPGPFYAATPDAATRAPGRLIRSEEMRDPPPGAKAWRILYSSTGLDGRPVTVSGIVVAPQLPAPIGGRPVVAWAHPTTGVAARTTYDDSDRSSAGQDLVAGFISGRRL